MSQSNALPWWYLAMPSFLRKVDEAYNGHYGVELEEELFQRARDLALIEKENNVIWKLTSKGRDLMENP